MKNQVGSANVVRIRLLPLALMALSFFLSTNLYSQKKHELLNCIKLNEVIDTNYMDLHGFYLINTDLSDTTWCIYYTNGQLYASYTLKDKKVQDVVKYYWPNGKLFVVERYKLGELDGEKLVYHKNAKICTKSYWRLGKRTGRWKFYDYNGKLLKVVKGTDPSLGPE